MKTEKHELEERVSSTETERDGVRLTLEKEQAAPLSDAEKSLPILKTEKHELEERMASGPSPILSGHISSRSHFPNFIPAHQKVA